MPICVACGGWSGPGSVLCPACRRTLAPAPAARLPSGLVVRGVFLHAGAARRLVHRLKYDGLPGVAELLAGSLAAIVPPDATALVPVPRARARRAAHGIDPAEMLARAVAARCGIPVVAALRPGVWWPRHAGRGRARRTAPRYRAARPVDQGAVLIDDVLTTGATLEAASAALGGIPTRALTATIAIRVRTGPPIRPSELLETAWRYHWGEGGDDRAGRRPPRQTPSSPPPRRAPA